MRYYVPDIRVEGEANDGPEKLGGVPWGLPSSKWPKCSECGKSQSLLGQFAHDSTRLDLGLDGRILFVFQCNHDPGICNTWEAFSGTNACFVLEPGENTHRSTPIPADAPPLDNEVRIAAWVLRDDGLPPGIEEAFANDRDYLNLSDETLQRVSYSTRIGGVPRWLQSADDAPKDGWHFAIQLDSTYSFVTPPQQAPEWVEIDPERYEGRSHVAQGPNFGFGLGYVFLRSGGETPEGCFLWQR